LSVNNTAGYLDQLRARRRRERGEGVRAAGGVEVKQATAPGRKEEGSPYIGGNGRARDRCQDSRVVAKKLPNWKNL
jgi:hypothetical protein